MTVVLTGISVIAGGALAYVNEETKGPIAEINERNLQNGIKQVILGSTEGELQVEQPEGLPQISPALIGFSLHMPPPCRSVFLSQTVYRTFCNMKSSICYLYGKKNPIYWRH